MAVLALADVAAALRCPVCTAAVQVHPAQVSCANGHRFDIARQGYVTLAGGRGAPGTGDSAAMVLAREQFLGGGYYQPLADALSGRAAELDPGGPGLVLDLAGGTGYYLAHVLDALPGRDGVVVDASAAALRRAARAHPRAVALGADAWQPLPLAGQSAALVLSVFGPRNPGEIRRVLVPGGSLLIASPGPDHQRELRTSLGLIGIDERKADRLAAAYGDLAAGAVTPVRYQLHLDHAAVTALAAMGPSARHVTPDVLAARIAAQPDPVTVTVDVELRSYRSLD
jgi:23S rRNA (guanine745-N1)-methyltransferase